MADSCRSAAVVLLDLQRQPPKGVAAGCPEGCAVAGEGPDGPLRVMSLNMLHGLPRFERLPERLDLLAAEIN